MANRTGNPFTPGFGHVPFALAGRTELIDDVIEGLANRPGDPNRSTIFFGPRGSGKTVLLSTISRIASEQGWIAAGVTAREGMLETLVWKIRAHAKHLLEPQGSTDITSVQIGPIGLEREVRHRDTGAYMELSMLAEELNEQGVGLLITVDEVDPSCDELMTLIDCYQHLVTEDREVALLLAGLPGQVSALLVDKHVSFIRRAFQRMLTTIPQSEVEEAFAATVAEGGRSIDREALEMAVAATGGYAFAIQLIGYYMWTGSSPDEPLGVEDARQAIRLAGREMERSVFIPTLRELRPREVDYLRAMARDEGVSTTSDIAKRMGISMTNASNLRRRLIEYGAIREVRMGQVEFEMPLIKEYLQEHPE